MWDAFVGLFLNVLLYIYHLIGSFGVAIILFTILIRLLTHPLTVSQLKGAQAMQELQKDPRYKEIQEKYKGDKERLQQEQLKLYQELKVNPFASCLPTLIQFPIIIALYQAVIRAMASTPMELHGLVKLVYPTLLDVSSLIPLKSQFLWMDLGQPDVIPLGNLPFGLPIMAILVVVSTYVQSKLMSPPSSTPGDQSAMMANMMNIYMPLLMGWLAYTLASGLSLYFLVSNVVGILQYAILGKVNWRNLIPRWAAQPAAASSVGSGSVSSARGAAVGSDSGPTAPKSTRPVKSAASTPRPRPKRK